MATEMASDEITDSIALIEMHRQEAQKESGLAAACSEALRQLNELLDSEKEALRLNGPDHGHTTNITAIANHIQRVKQMAGGGGSRQGQAAGAGRAHPRPQQGGQQQAGRSNGSGEPGRSGGPGGQRNNNGSRNRGRRTMGRRAGGGGGGGGGAR